MIHCVSLGYQRPSMLATSSSSSRFDSRYFSFASWNQEARQWMAASGTGWSIARSEDDVMYLVLLLPLVTLLFKTRNLPLEMLSLDINLSQPSRRGRHASVPC